MNRDEAKKKAYTYAESLETDATTVYSHDTYFAVKCGSEDTLSNCKQNRVFNFNPARVAPPKGRVVKIIEGTYKGFLFWSAGILSESNNLICNDKEDFRGTVYFLSDWQELPGQGEMIFTGVTCDACINRMCQTCKTNIPTNFKTKE